MLRVLAGTVGIGILISWWLIIAATLISLLMALSKRCLEKRLGLEQQTRAVLNKYSSLLLNYLMYSTAACCFIVYSIYTLVVRHDSLSFLLTLPVAAMGLSRFVWLSINTIPQSSGSPLMENSYVCDGVISSSCLGGEGSQEISYLEIPHDDPVSLVFNDAWSCLNLFCFIILTGAALIEKI
jgi:hypothetical protein